MHYIYNYDLCSITNLIEVSMKDLPYQGAHFMNTQRKRNEI